jgi:hypothetical protein
MRGRFGVCVVSIVAVLGCEPAATPTPRTSSARQTPASERNVEAAEPNTKSETSQSTPAVTPEPVPPQPSPELQVFPIMPNPSPEQAALMDLPDPTLASLRERKPGQNWWCYDGYAPPDVRVTDCEGTQRACEQHRQFMAFNSKVDGRPCSIQGVAYCRGVAFPGNDPIIECKTSLGDCQRSAVVFMRSGMRVRHSKNCVVAPGGT